MRFAELTAPDIRGLDRGRILTVVPIAACEQHSRHLPVLTDSILVGAVADGLEAALPDRILLLPVLWLGASEHHLPCGGTLSARLDTYQDLLGQIITPMLAEGFSRILILNGHGGNIDPLRVALRRLVENHPGAILTGAAYWEIAEAELAAHCEGLRKTVGHACEIETSMMLALRPELVRTDQIADDPDSTPPGLAGTYWARDFARRTDHGAVGYPERASAEKGRRMLDATITKVTSVTRVILELPLGGAGPAPAN